MDSFHRHLPLLNMRYVYLVCILSRTPEIEVWFACHSRCDLDPHRVAVWYSPQYKIRLSAFAAEILASSGQLDINELKLHRALQLFSPFKRL